jgi:hypothetical protein
LCSAANPLIIAKMVVPTLGNLETIGLFTLWQLVLLIKLDVLSKRLNEYLKIDDS